MKGNGQVLSIKYTNNHLIVFRADYSSLSIHVAAYNLTAVLCGPTYKVPPCLVKSTEHSLSWKSNLIILSHRRESTTEIEQVILASAKQSLTLQLRVTAGGVPSTSVFWSTVVLAQKHYDTNIRRVTAVKKNFPFTFAGIMWPFANPGKM